MVFLEEGKVKPIQPRSIFEARNAEDAFRHMQTGQHMGKIVIKIGDPDQVPVATDERPVSFSPDYSYVLVGGTGGIGRSIGRWMVENGARNLVFLSRSAGTSLCSKAYFQELELMGCAVNAVSGSVMNFEDVQSAIALCPKPLAGVIQLAMDLKVRTSGLYTKTDIPVPELICNTGSNLRQNDL
jgi:hypothetical protein